MRFFYLFRYAAGGWQPLGWLTRLDACAAIRAEAAWFYVFDSMSRPACGDGLVFGGGADTRANWCCDSVLPLYEPVR